MSLNTYVFEVLANPKQSCKKMLFGDSCGDKEGIRWNCILIIENHLHLPMYHWITGLSIFLAIPADGIILTHLSHYKSSHTFYVTRLNVYFEVQSFINKGTCDTFNKDLTNFLAASMTTLGLRLAPRNLRKKHCLLLKTGGLSKASTGHLRHIEANRGVC